MPQTGPALDEYLMPIGYVPMGLVSNLIWSKTYLVDDLLVSINYETGTESAPHEQMLTKIPRGQTKLDQNILVPVLHGHSLEDTD